MQAFFQSPYWLEFIALALAHLVAVISPGPDFAIVSRTSVHFGARVGLWVSIGIALGILIHVSYSIFGLALIIHTTPFLYALLLFAAAGYFYWLATVLIVTKQSNNTGQEHSNQNQRTESVPSCFKAITLGFLTNGLNIKATLFFLALFTSIISVQTPLWVKASYGVYLVVATFIWFAALSLLLGKTQLRYWLLRHGYWFDRAMGVVVLLLALHLSWQWFSLVLK